MLIGLLLLSSGGAQRLTQPFLATMKALVTLLITTAISSHER
jgi:hypothetical protein